MESSEWSGHRSALPPEPDRAPATPPIPLTPTELEEPCRGGVWLFSSERIPRVRGGFKKSCNFQLSIFLFKQGERTRVIGGVFSLQNHLALALLPCHFHPPSTLPTLTHCPSIPCHASHPQTHTVCPLLIWPFDLVGFKRDRERRVNLSAQLMGSNFSFCPKELDYASFAFPPLNL